MNVKIGEKMKSLRKRDDVTQEKLAEALGLTSQAISRWESGGGYPDIEYIMPIANFFNVTTDYLFGHDTAEKRRKIDAYIAQYTKSQLEKPPRRDEQIDLMRQALAEFPAEETLLMNLADALFWKWATNGTWSVTQEDGYTAPDIDKNKSNGSWEEAVKIMEELLTSSTDDVIRGRCRYLLADIYGAIGEKEKLLAIAEKCGSVHHSKENILSKTVWGEDGVKYKQMLLDSLLVMLQNTLRPLAWRADADTEDEMFSILFNLHKFIFRDDCGVHNHWLTFLYGCYAHFLSKNNKPDETLKALEQAFANAKMFAEFAGGTSEKMNTTPFTNLLKTAQEKNRDCYTPGSEVHGLLIELKKNCYQELLRENAGFAALVKEVEDWVAEN